MKLLVDMNFSPAICPVLAIHGHDAVHWSDVGPPDAGDDEVMSWAHADSRVVLTHDLDFSAMLAATRARGPSVLQVRIQDVFPDVLEALLARVLRDFESHLLSGAIVTVDESRSRVRVLPIGP